MTTRGFRMRTDRALAPGAVAALDPALAPALHPLLDSAQAEVLGLPDGASAAVLGAPGTGKTTTLVEAVAERVLGRGYGTGEVLALSASRTAATALRDRIALRLEVPTNGPLARTATSLAFQLVGSARAAPASSPRDSSPAASRTRSSPSCSTVTSRTPPAPSGRSRWSRRCECCAASAPSSASSWPGAPNAV
ncbi:UvrD-helicase domain-containing protein [Leifsonia xyli]|uniref:UvrD-helicase domain-containing protein n=1 Tax=Leifsonia xyli TaxID=1575 RepID=UPI003D66D51D